MAAFTQSSFCTISCIHGASLKETWVALYLVHELAVGLHVRDHLLAFLDSVRELEQRAQVRGCVQFLPLLRQRVFGLPESLPPRFSAALKVPERPYLELFQLPR